MQHSRLFELLQTFNRKEQRELRKFLASPYYNQRVDVSGLFELLIGRSNSRSPAPDKEEVFRLLYGADDEFDDHRVRMVMSLLLKCCEQFLVNRSIFKEEVRVKLHLAALFRRRNLPKHFQRAMREAKVAHEKQPFRHEGYYSDDWQLQMEQYRFDVSQHRLAEHNLQAVTDHLDTAYIARKLRHTCLLLSHQAVYRKEYRHGLLEAVLTEVETAGLLSLPVIAVYYHCFRALTVPEEPLHFQRLKELLVTEGKRFPSEEIADLYLLAINYCIKRYNEGDRTYLADEFELYRQGLKKDYFLRQGMLSRFTYRNVVTVGLAMQAFDWTAAFIHDFKDKLEKGQRESMYSFNLARLEFERRQFGAALQLLQQADYRDLLLNLAAKALLLKVFYETAAYDALASHLDAMQRFIRRKKIIGYHRENYLHLILFTRRLMEVYDKKDLAILRSEIEGAGSVAEKGWLLGHCNDEK